MAQEPYNIIVAPFDVWTAATGTAFPEIDEAPGVGWTKLGTNGNLEYGDDGVHVIHESTVDYHRFLGSTGPRKATRSEEGLRVEMTLHDLTLESYAKAIGAAAPTTVAAGVGTVGTKEVGLHRGFDVIQYSLLVRGPSPYGNWNMQYEIPVVIFDNEPDVVFNKTTPAGLAIVAVAMEDPDAATQADRFGRLLAMSAEATA